MIFYTNENAFESEKERNFYYKLFAGYLLNNLIPGYESRLVSLIKVLNAPIYQGAKATPVPHLDSTSVRVSFDNHGYLLKQYSGDNGEFADVLIQDIKQKIFIPVEAKLFSDWSYEKDIVQNGERHKVIKGLISELTIYPVLLVTQKKWDQVSSRSNRSDSNYEQLIRDKETKFRVICWEHLLPLIDEPQVLKYTKMVLGFKHQEDMELVVDSSWIKRPITGKM